MASVLVIDDDRAVLRLVEKTLEGTNRQIITARTAAEGMARLQEMKPDVLLAGHHAAGGGWSGVGQACQGNRQQIADYFRNGSRRQRHGDRSDEAGGV